MIEREKVKDNDECRIGERQIQSGRGLSIHLSISLTLLALVEG